MSHSYEKAVKGATKIKLAAPKSKYIETILSATQNGDAGVAEVFRTLQHRVRDSTWTVAFKALIVVHLMLREGHLNATLGFLAQNPNRIAVSEYSEVQTQGHNIIRYAHYLMIRARAFSDTKVDYVRSGQGRLKRLSVNKGLLRETEVVQQQIKALLQCDLLTSDVENEITLTAFRLLTLDLLTLFSVMNEGTINVLEHYFEMSRPDSERALSIYKRFASQTEQVVKFLGVARHFESATRLEIPNLKHASTDLARLLEDDLNDPDFELRRREYLAQKEAQKTGRPTTAPSGLTAKKPADVAEAPKTAHASQGTSKSDFKAPPADLMDFFEPIEQNQQPPTQQQSYGQQPNFYRPAAVAFQQSGFQPQQTGFYSQPTGFQSQQTGFAQPKFEETFAPQGNSFGYQQVQQTLQSTPTGAGFGGYSERPQSYTFQSTLSPIPQDGAVSFPQQQQFIGSRQRQSSNPLRRQNTNPFARRLSMVESRPPGSVSPAQQIQPLQTSPPPLQPQRTGTNPFARSVSVPPSPQAQGLQPPAAAPLRPNPTGSTNPFRQSAFINQQTGQGWHVSGQQGPMGGLERLETVPIFPRPGVAHQ